MSLAYFFVCIRWSKQLRISAAAKLMSEVEREKVVTTIAKDPEAGDVIAGTGGFRKLRIALQGGGKSGGSRVIYLPSAQLRETN